MTVLASALLAREGFAHGFSLRDLDFVPGPARDAQVVRFAEEARLDPRALYQASQVHGSRVVRAEGDPREVAKEEADALVAEVRGRAVGVRVADCVPLLVGDPASGAVAAIHAGWRGVVAGVVAAGVAELARASEARGAPMKSARLVAAIGPCIGPCCFEVGRDVADTIEGAAPVEGVVARVVGDKAFVDLRRAVRAQLRALGVVEVEDVEGCTRCDAARFFSYRRDGANGGRHLAAIAAR